MRILYSMAKSVKKSLKKSVKKSLKNKSRRTKNRFSRKVGKRRNGGGDETVVGKVSIIPPVKGEVTLTKKIFDKDENELKKLMKKDENELKLMKDDDLGDDFDDDDGFVTKSHDPNKTLNGMLANDILKNRGNPNIKSVAALMHANSNK